jgi:hypothetical protein
MPLDPNELVNAPKITLGRTEFAIPEMGPKQILKLIGLFNRSKNAYVEGKAPEEADVAVLYDIVYVAVTRARPDLSREEFDDMPMPIRDVNKALPVIIKSCGMEESKLGEAQAVKAHRK